MKNRHGTAVISLPSDREIAVTRVFDAPARLVFDAWTTPDLVRRWWGWGTSPMIVCEIDLRVGGSWRFVTREPGGVELGWHGVYREIVPARRLVSTEVFEGHPDAESVNTLTFAEHDAVTTLTITIRHASVERRDGHISSGMEAGLQVSLDRLEELVVQRGLVPTVHAESEP